MLPVSAILFVCLSGAGYYAISARRELLEDQLRRRMRVTLAGLVSSAREALITERHTSMRLLVQKLASEDKDIVFLKVSDRDGTVLASNRRPPGSAPIETQTGVRYFKEEIVSKGYTLGQVELGIQDSGIREATDRATNFLLLTLLDVLLLVGFGVHMATKIFASRPLEQLVETTQTISQGDFDRRTQFESSDEIGTLAQAFDLMAESLGKYRTEVENNQRLLEARVQERTKELQAAEAKTSAILNNLPLSVLVVDSEKVIREANPEALGLTELSGNLGTDAPAPFDTVGSSCKALLDTQFCREDCLLDRARAGQPKLEEARLGTSEKPVLLECAPLGDGGIVTVRDMTRLDAMRTQIRRSDRLSSLGSLAAGLAHELNNPLGNVSTYSQLLQEAGPDSPKAERLLGTIRSECDRAAGIVGRLLSFARPEPIRLEKLTLDQVLKPSFELMQPVLEAKGVELKFKPSHGPPLDVMVDASSLQQVVVNLILNAAHAVEGQPEGQVLLQVLGNSSEQWPSFQVCDNGPGIPEEAMAKLFDPFFTTKDPGVGTGLGLSVCYGILRDHGGLIEVSTGESGGAVFTVKLPAIPKSENWVSP